MKSSPCTRQGAYEEQATRNDLKYPVGDANQECYKDHTKMIYFYNANGNGIWKGANEIGLENMPREVLAFFFLL